MNALTSHTTNIIVGSKLQLSTWALWLCWSYPIRSLLLFLWVLFLVNWEKVLNFNFCISKYENM